jgi:hypothetical protein
VRIGKGAGMAAAPNMAAAGTAQPTLRSVTTSAGRYDKVLSLDHCRPDRLGEAGDRQGDGRVNSEEAFAEVGLVLAANPDGKRCPCPILSRYKSCCCA